MKTITSSVILLTICFVLAGCPVNTSVPLMSRANAVPFDASLLGDWKNISQSAEVEEIYISRTEDRNSYKIKVLKSSDDYWGDDYYDAWFVKFNNGTFLITQSYAENKLTNNFYVQEVARFQDFFLLIDFKLDGISDDDIKTSEELQAAIKKSLKAQGDDFYKKTEKWVRKDK